MHSALHTLAAIDTRQTCTTSPLPLYLFLGSEKAFSALSTRCVVCVSVRTEQNDDDELGKSGGGWLVWWASFYCSIVIPTSGAPNSQGNATGRMRIVGGTVQCQVDCLLLCTEDGADDDGDAGHQ